jgi:hypothetical protein
VRGFDHHKFWNEILGQVVVGKFSPVNMDIQHPTLRFMHCWIVMTIFSRQDIQIMHNAEIKILYATIRKIKIAPVKEMFNHWLEVIKTFTTTVATCTSMVTCIANGVGALQNQQIEYITTPRLIIDEHYLIQGHHLKHNPASEIVFFFPGRTNEIQLPNLGLHLYNSPALTFPLISQEEALRKSIFGRVTRRQTRNEASSSRVQPQPPHPVSLHPRYCIWGCSQLGKYRV